MVVLTVMAAAASCMLMPCWAKWRVIMTGPPIWPPGIRLLADSPGPPRQQRPHRGGMRPGSVEQHANRHGIQPKGSK
jgi:hypothetical protein